MTLAASKRVVRGAALAAALVLSCAPAQAPRPPKVRGEMVVSTDWLASWLGRPEVAVLHVGAGPSAQEEYDTGHIPGARLVLFGDIAAPRGGVSNEIPPAESLAALSRRVGIAPRGRIVVYDTSTGLMAARAYVVLDYMGLGDRTSILDGHLKKWKAENRLLSTTAPEAPPGAFVPRPRPEIVVPIAVMRDLSWIKEREPGSPFELIDSRAEPFFTGAEPASGPMRPGRIPGATNLYWMSQIAGAENPVLKPVAELRAMYESAGVSPGEMIVAYCNSGVQASHIYVVAKYLGYDVRLYDGSYSEWSADPNAPIATGPVSR